MQRYDEIRVSPDALDDLDGIWDVIAEDDAERAFSFVNEIRKDSILVHEVFHQKRIHIRSYHRG